jgi:hypothetical protein
MPRSRPLRRPYRAWKILAGALLLVPNAFGVWVLARQLSHLQVTNPIQLAFLTGAGVYAVMHLLLWKPIFMHVMGHELTHAFWALLLGGRIKSLQVSAAGGQVTLSKTNFLIALAPYFFPFYTCLLLPIYLISAVKFYPILAFLLGFTLAFHIALTLHSMRDPQSDLREVGLFFSLNFIFWMNLFMVVVILYVISPELVTPLAFLREVGAQAWQLGDALLHWLLSPSPRAGR